MNKNKLVTGVITTYKRPAPMVLRAVKSVFYQTHPNMEVIVVDDSPNDYSERDEVKKALSALSKDIKYIRHNTSLGACAARNTGLKEAHGEYIGFLDDDDEWCPAKVEIMLPLFNKSEIGLVYCGSICRIVETGEEFPLIKKFYSEKIFDRLIFENFIGSTSFPLMKTDYVREVGGFDVNQKASQDHDLWLRMSEKYSVNYTTENLVYYYVHTNEQISKNHKNKIAGYESLNAKHLNYLRCHKKAYAKRLLILAVEYSADHQKLNAVKLILRMIRLDPTNIRQVVKGLKYIW